MTTNVLALNLYLENQRQLNSAKKLLSNVGAQLVLPGSSVLRLLKTLTSFVESTSETRTNDTLTYRQVSKKGILCALEYSVRNIEGQNYVTTLEISFPHTMSKLQLIGSMENLFSAQDDKKWEPREHEWDNVQVKFITELLEIASSSSITVAEECLPSPLYHLLLELLQAYPLPLLQIGMIKSALLALRTGSTHEIPFYADTVLSNLCRDLLLPFTHSPPPIDADPLQAHLANGRQAGHASNASRKSSLAVFRALFHGPHGTGKSRIARFVAEECGFRVIFCGTPAQLNREFKNDVIKFKKAIDEQMALLRAVPSLFIIDGADENIPPLGSLPFLLSHLVEFPNLLVIATAQDVRAVDKCFFRSGEVAHIYFSRPYARNRIEILAQTFALRGFMRAAALLRVPFVKPVAARLRKLVCGRTGAQLIALCDACARRCAMDDPASADPALDFVLPRLERASRDLLMTTQDPDICDWSAGGEEIAPPDEWNELVLKANNLLSGRILCDVDEGKLVIEYADGKVHPMWFAQNPRGPSVAQQLALGFAASLIEPSTVVVVDSRRQELTGGDAEAGVGYAKLISDLRSAGARGGALVVIDVDDMVGVVTDTSSRVLNSDKQPQDPTTQFSSTKLLREHILHKIVSFTSLASFVRDFSDRNFCLILAVTRDVFIRDRLTAAFKTDIPFPLETSFIPRGLHISPSLISTLEDEDDAAGCICSKAELQVGESYLWIAQVFLTHGSVSLGVVHSSVNTLSGRSTAGVIGENYGTWGFRISTNGVEVCQSPGVHSKAILSPLPEAHENPMRTTVRNNRTIFGVFLQSISSGIQLHLLRFLPQQGSASNRWEHVAFKRIDNLEGLKLMPAFGISKKFSSIQIVACHCVPSTWFPCDVLPDAQYHPVYIPAVRSASSVSLFKGGLHLSASSVYLDKTRIQSGKKALVRFRIHDKATPTPATTSQRAISRELTKTTSGMNIFLNKILPEHPRLTIGFMKESDANSTLTCYSIFGFNPNLARCYYAHDSEREIPSLLENPQKAGYLYIDLCPTSPYCGSIHYFKIRVMGNLLYSGSLIEGLTNETYRAAICFDDPTTEQGKSLGIFGTAKIGAGLGREFMPSYISEWYPLDYGVKQGLLSFSPDPNTMRQEREGMNSRFTKELTPVNADWHYIECRIYSCTGNSQVILGFIPSGDLDGTLHSHVGARGTSGFGFSVHGDVFLGNSGATRSNTKFSTPPKDYIRVGLLLSIKLGEVHLFWAEVGSPGPVDYKGILFENVSDAIYRFVISASHAGTTITWRGFSCDGSLPQAKASVLARTLDFHEISGNVAYASRNYVVFPGMDIIGDDVTVIANVTPQQLRDETERIGGGAFTSSGTIKDYSKIYQRMRIVGNRVELAGLIGPVCSDFCLRVHIQGYVFIPQHDALGNEIDAETADLLAVAQRCTQDATALAFNTGGFIKFSLSSWILYLSDPGASGCFSGIFVKQSYLCSWLGTMDPKQCLTAIRLLVGEGQSVGSSDVHSNWAIN